MKKNLRKPGNTTRADRDDILSEYDFSRARPNKYASRYKEGASVVTLDPDAAAVFQNPGEVNEACARWRRSFTNTGGAGSRLCGTHKKQVGGARYLLSMTV